VGRLRRQVNLKDTSSRALDGGQPGLRTRGSTVEDGNVVGAPDAGMPTLGQVGVDLLKSGKKMERLVEDPRSRPGVKLQGLAPDFGRKTECAEDLEPSGPRPVVIRKGHAVPGVANRVHEA